MNDNDINNKLEYIENICCSMNNSIFELLKLCNDHNEEIRLRSMEALQYIKTPNVEAQIYNALKDNDELVRVEVIEILALWKSLDATDGMIEALSDESALVRSTAAIALADIGAINATEDIVNSLINADDEEKVGLHYALCKLGNDSYLSPFLNGFFHEFYRIRCATANLVNGLINPFNKELILNMLSYVLTYEKTEAAKSSIKNAIKKIGGS